MRDPIGLDPGSPDGDDSAICALLNGFAVVYTVPREYGCITDITTFRGRVLIKTEHGPIMLLPLNGGPPEPVKV